MAKAPERWAIVQMTNDEVLKRYRDILDYILPKSLVGKNYFNTSHVPYAYPTIKYKCFKAAGQRVCRSILPLVPGPPSNHPHPAHTCAKDGHSCLQTIISFKKIPGRRAFKRIGRAFMHCVAAIAPGYGLRDLSRGKPVLDNEIKKQFRRRKDSKHGYLKCGACMSTPTRL